VFKTHIYEREFIFFGGEQASCILAALSPFMRMLEALKQKRGHPPAQSRVSFIGPRLCGQRNIKNVKAHYLFGMRFKFLIFRLLGTGKKVLSLINILL